jgi:hypothetical protein
MILLTPSTAPRRPGLLSVLFSKNQVSRYLINVLFQIVWLYNPTDVFTTWRLLRGNTMSPDSVLRCLLYFAEVPPLGKLAIPFAFMPTEMINYKVWSFKFGLIRFSNWQADKTVRFITDYFLLLFRLWHRKDFGEGARGSPQLYWNEARYPVLCGKSYQILVPGRSREYLARSRALYWLYQDAS